MEATMFKRVMLAVLPIVALMISCFVTGPAMARLIYTFTTRSPAPVAGPLNGSFSVADSAIVDGFIFGSEIMSFEFALPSARSPFVPAIFSMPDTLEILSPFGGGLLVDPIKGNFILDGNIIIRDAALNEEIAFTVRLMSTYGVYIGTVPFDLGEGQWDIRVVAVPEPELIWLLAMGATCALLSFRVKKARQVLEASDLV